MNREHDCAHQAVMYLRVARTQNDSDAAIITQRAACERIAARYGVTVVREYIDIGRPARLTQQTELRRLLADLERLHDVAYVVVWDYARLGRDFQSLDNVVRRIHTYGAEVATLTGVETAERFTTGELLERVAEWATQPPDLSQSATIKRRQQELKEELNATVEAIRSGSMNAEQREALASLLFICGNATLPTPVVAAVFNVVEACQRTSWGNEQASEQSKQ